MTSSVERKQYDWKAEPDRSFFKTMSVGQRDIKIITIITTTTTTQTLHEGKNCSSHSKKLFYSPIVSRTAALVSDSSLYKDPIFKSISAALCGSDPST